MSQGTVRAGISNLQDISQAPLCTWDYMGSPTEGPEDYWATQSSGYSKIWWELGDGFAPVFSVAGSSSQPFLIGSTEPFLEI